MNFRKSIPLCYIDNRLLVLCKWKLYFVNLNDQTIISEKIMDFNICSFKRRIFSNFAILKRRFGLNKINGIAYDDENIIINYHKKFYLVNLKSTTIKKIKTSSSCSNTLYFSKIGNDIYYGDYFYNPEREEININIYDHKLNKFEKVYTFPKGEINHIHNIIEGKNNRIWILCGDFGNSASIYYTDDDFKNVNRFLYGNQKYRTCFLYQNEKELIYATDTPLEENFLRKINLTDNKISEENIVSINGSCIYGCKCGDWLVYSTTVENQPNEKNNSPSKTTNQLGKGIKSRFIEVFAYNVVTQEYKVLSRFKKDSLPMLAYGYGYIKLFSNKTNQVIGYGNAICKYDHKTIRFIIKNGV